MAMVVGDSALSATNYWRNAEKARPSCQHGSVILSRDVPGARKALELEIEAVGLVMSSLCARYNSLTPVNRLPPEVLVNIFHCLRHIHPPVNTDLRKIDKLAIPAKVFGWIQITHVCSLWRTLAIGTPSLWCHIPFYFLGAKWTEEFLRRSRPAPVRFSVEPVHEDNFDDYDMEQFGRYIEHHLPQLQELSVVRIFEDLTPCLPSLTAPAPLLEKLVLMNGPMFSFDDSEMTSLPLDIFRGSAPRLRHIGLERWYFIPWAALAFSSLVHLEVFQDRRDFSSYGRASKLERYQAEFRTILGALENMPSLETLTFEQVFPPPPRGVTPQSVYCPAVTLHKLREFNFTDDIRNCELVLQHIDALHAVRYQVHCIRILWGRRYLPRWLTAVHARMSGPIRRLSIVEDRVTVRLDFSTRSSGDVESSAAEHPPSQIPLFDLALIAPKDNYELSLSQMQDIFRVLPLENLEELHISYDMKWMTQDWSTVFGGLGHEVFRHVSVYSSSGSLLCELLMSEDWLKDWAPDRLSKLQIKEDRMDKELVDRLKNVVSEAEWDALHGGHDDDSGSSAGDEEEEDQEEDQDQDDDYDGDEGPDDEGGRVQLEDSAHDMRDSALSAAEYWRNAEQTRFAGQHGSSTIENHDVLDARKMLELEMKAIDALGSSVRTRYNGLSSINHLPPEVLAHIFHFLREIYTILPNTRYYRSTMSSKLTGWVQVTHVCRQWRDVALGHPALWSDIAFKLGRNWTDEFLRRSRKFAIAIDCDMLQQREAWYDDMEELITQHLSHTRLLRLEGFVDDFSPITPALRGRAPLLEKAVLLNEVNPYGADDSLFLPPDIFDGIAPRLCDLRLQEWVFSWASIAFETLVHLELIQIPDGPIETGLDLGQVLEVLARMPSLKFLKLTNVLPPLAHDVTPHSVFCPHVTLSKLHNLLLTGNIRTCGILLKHLDIPMATKCLVDCNVVGPSREYEFLLPWLFTRVNTSPSIRALTFEDRERGLFITASDHTGNTSDTKSSVSEHADEESPFTLGLSGSGIARREPTALQLHTLTNALPLDNLEVLKLHVYRNWTVQDWSVIFSKCKGLRHAGFSSAYGSHLCELLMQEEYSPQGRSQPLFVSLETLVLLGMSLSGSADFCAKLLRWLQWRQHWGRLRKLTIKYCTVHEEFVEKLRIEVEEVDWHRFVRVAGDG
ncbi:hypothetical protein EVG20_g3352 [Dentipellis fragilis]|uniref:F-box domain-containing protein n=1 Tax=Dentipellis fragilis TaxID=205917 RepID=A0A4Y9Z577_9AGAM|nr:hypothetical protein EVG20_g3352 [Dentipellis fragilis]